MLSTLLLALVPQIPSGFEAQDLVVKDVSTQTFQLVDPIDGAVSTVSYASLGNLDAGIDDFDYDPYRDRLAFRLQLTGGAGLGLFLGDASGSATLVQTWASFGPSGALAADGKGRIYYRRQQFIEYVDLDGSIQVLKDSMGANFDTGFTAAARMEYDPGSNTLISCNNTFTPCTGDAVRVRRFDLSPDGTQVLGEDCASFDVGSFLGGNGEPKGLTLLEPGKLLLACEGSEPSGTVTKIVKLVEPTSGPGGTIAISDWVDPTLSYAGGNTIDGVAYCYARDQAVLLNGFFDSIYAYDEADGSPTVIFTTPIGRNGFTDIRSAGSKGLSALGAGGSGTSKISVGTGGQQDLQVDFGAPAAGEIYFVAGSFSGFTPYQFAGVSIPVTFDIYTTYTINNSNTGPLVNTFGVLDAVGTAQVAIALPPGSPATLAGVVAHHAAVRISPTTATVLESTGAVSLELLP